MGAMAVTCSLISLQRPTKHTQLSADLEPPWILLQDTPRHLILDSTMANGGEKNFNLAYEAFRKHSADLLMAIQDPEVLAWELYAENIISSEMRDAVNNRMHERCERTSKLLAAVDSQIAVDPEVFNVFLSVLSKQPSMSDLSQKIKNAYSKSNSGQ